MLNIRVLDRIRCSAAHGLDLRFIPALDSVRHVVAEADIIYAAVSQDLLVLRLHDGGIALAFPRFFGISAVVAAAVDVHEVEPAVHSLVSQHDVIRITGVRIYGYKRAHAADLEVGIDLMSFLNHQGRSDQLMVSCLIEGLLGIVKL